MNCLHLFTTRGMRVANRHVDNPMFKLVLFIFVVANFVACVPFRGTQPVRTWHPAEPEATCAPESLTDPTSVRWSSANRAALESKLAQHEPVIVSVLGCHVDVLDRCRPTVSANEPAVLAKNLEGECTGATHVVRAPSAGTRATGAPIELTPLSLDGFKLTGTWQGAMRQPQGPYEVYDATMELVQEGDRVRGITRLTTIDGAYWGDLRFEGRLEGNTLFFADTEVIDDNLGIFLAWCLKGGYLLVDPREERLRGPWKAGFCIPGTMEVRFVGENRHMLAQTTPR